MIHKLTNMFFKDATKNMIYAYSTVGYGALRKLIQVYDCQIQYDYTKYSKDGKDNKEPMLGSTKLLLTGVCGFASVYWWPYYMFLDMDKLEMFVRSKKPKDYGICEPRFAFDYLFN